MRKVGIYVYDLTIQSLFLQLFEKENLKEKNKLEGFEKERKKTHFEHPGVDFGIFYLGGPNI